MVVDFLSKTVKERQPHKWPQRQPAWTQQRRIWAISLRIMGCRVYWVLPGPARRSCTAMQQTQGARLQISQSALECNVMGCKQNDPAHFDGLK